MCNGIAVIVYGKDGNFHGLCTGTSSHDVLCREVEELRYGKIEPYRFELLYPCNLVFDRAHDFKGSIGIASEQPEKKIWDVAFDIAKPYFMSHSKNQLMNANLSEANLHKANLSWANLPEADLYKANLSEADLYKANLSGTNLSEADLSWANLSGTNLSEADLYKANLSEAKYTNYTIFPADFDEDLKENMILE